MNRWDNARGVIQNMKVNEYNNRPSTMTYHDLRPPEVISASPLQFGKLLGLGLKFCLQEERPKESALDECMSRFKRDVRLKYTFAGCPKTEQCHKKIYVKSSWQPDSASKLVEECMLDFENDIRKERAVARARPKATNLSKYQFACLQHL